jgi:hypothetical protein
LDIHGWKTKPETEPETKPEPNPKTVGEKSSPNPNPRDPKPADTRPEPDPLPSLLRIEELEAHRFDTSTSSLRRFALPYAGANTDRSLVHAVGVSAIGCRPSVVVQSSSSSWFHDLGDFFYQILCSSAFKKIHVYLVDGLKLILEFKPFCVI